jgi:hypothetical protein
MNVALCIEPKHEWNLSGLYIRSVRSTNSNGNQVNSIFQIHLQ